MANVWRSRFVVAMLGIGLTVLLFGGVVVLAGDSSPVRPRPGLWADLTDSPATIGVGEPKFRVTLTPLDGRLSNNTWPLSTLDHWLDKRIPLDVREQFIEAVPGEGFVLAANSRHALRLGIGSFALDFGLRTSGTAGLGRDVLTLGLLGNELNREYLLAGTGMDVFAFGDAAAVYSFAFHPSLRVGLRYHHLFSGTYVDVSVAGDGQFIYTEDETGTEATVDVHYVHAGLNGPGGSGAAWDVGADVALHEKLAVGVALLDMGGLHWSEAVQGTCTWSVAFGQFGEEPEAENQGCSETTLGEWTRRLPGRWQVAVGWQPVPAWHFGAAYTGRLSAADDAIGCRECAGLEGTVVWQGLKFLQLGLAGVFDGDGAPVISGAGALRLGPLQLRARLHDVPGLFGAGTAKAVGFGFDMGIVF